MFGIIICTNTKIFAAIQNNVKKDVEEIGKVINDAMSDIQRLQDSSGLSGVPSGFPSLDKITLGWQASDQAFRDRNISFCRLSL